MHSQEAASVPAYRELPIPGAHAPLNAFANLPIDVLRLILSYFANYPRLFLFSLVCKRWRTAAVTSITRFRPLRSEKMGDTLSLLSSVTDLKVITPNIAEGAAPSIALPLRSLTLNKLRRGCACAAFKGITSLTKLKLRYAGLFCACSIDLLRNNAATVRSLSIYVSTSSKPDFFALSSLKMPSLTSLSSDLTSAPFVALISAHASQLTALNLAATGPIPYDNLSAVRFPNLLRARGALPDSPEFISHAPKLKSVALSTASGWAYVDWQPRVQRYGLLLEDMDAQRMNLARETASSVLSRAPHLKAVYTSHPSAFQSIANQIETMRVQVSSSAELPKAFVPFTHLRWLAIHAGLSPTRTVSQFKVPASLEVLYVDTWDVHSADALSESFAPMLSQCPRLRVFAVTSIGWTESAPEADEEVSKFLRVITSKTCIEEVYFGSALLREDSLCKFRKQYPWLRISLLMDQRSDDCHTWKWSSFP